MFLTNALTSLMSAFAVLFSAYSLWESVLRAPDLALFVSPRIEYTDPDRPEAVREVFILPMTIANDGARTANIQSINLEVTNPRTKQSKFFYAARLGTWAETPIKPFAPVVLSGKGTYSHALQFEPRPGEAVARILDQEGGTYLFKLTLDLAGTEQDRSGLATLQFEMKSDALDYRYFQGAGTMMMWAPDHRSPTNVKAQ